MTVTLEQMQDQIYEILGKSRQTYGLLTPTKVTAMINDSMRHIMTLMLGMNASWANKVDYLDVVGDSHYVDLPADCAVVNFLKMKNATDTAYQPLKYNENYDGATSVQAQSPVSYSPIYHFVNSKIWLDPIPDANITDGIMIEYIAFPTELVSNNDPISGDFGGGVYLDYIKWRSASMLRAITQASAAPVPWAQYEAEAQRNVMTIISRRKRVATTIRGVPY